MAVRVIACDCAEALTAKARGMPIISTLGCVANSKARKMGGICVRPYPTTASNPASNVKSTDGPEAAANKRTK